MNYILYYVKGNFGEDIQKTTDIGFRRIDYFKHSLNRPSNNFNT